VRTEAAAKLYEAILTYEEGLKDVPDLPAGMALLSETVWTLPVEELRPIRNQLCAYLNIPSPVIVPKKGNP